ncbi:hypothetical protein BKA70DRAFT_1558928 [Coprinopsis sp. MPI-PUGE-AT-0042]|nr:hypothetical protein BKA70DRAFT_1558928 [Coprinopsis sp. MPI-PUGE-AT-0042]
MKLTTLATLGAPGVLCWIGIASAARGFSQNCRNITLDEDKYLEMYCAKSDKIVVGIDLNQCIGIGDTNLECRPGNGHYTEQGCSECALTTGTEMRCQCPGGEKSIDLDTCMGSDRENFITCSDSDLEAGLSVSLSPSLTGILSLVVLSAFFKD